MAVGKYNCISLARSSWRSPGVLPHGVGMLFLLAAQYKGTRHYSTKMVKFGFRPEAPVLVWGIQVPNREDSSIIQ